MHQSSRQNLHRRARHIGRGAAATLSTTNGCANYLKLAGRHLALNDNAHFFAVAARAMRQVLLKCGARWTRTPARRRLHRSNIQ